MAFYKFSVTDKGMTVILSMEMKIKEYVRAILLCTIARHSKASGLELP